MQLLASLDVMPTLFRGRLSGNLDSRGPVHSDPRLTAILGPPWVGWAASAATAPAMRPQVGK